MESPLSSFQEIMKSGNPMGVLQNIAKSNPTLQNVFLAWQASKMSPRDFFYQYAAEKGVNADQFLQSLGLN